MAGWLMKLKTANNSIGAGATDSVARNGRVIHHRALEPADSYDNPAPSALEFSDGAHGASSWAIHEGFDSERALAHQR